MRTAKTDPQDDQSDLSLRWAHMPFCWFCYAAAPIISNIILDASMCPPSAGCTLLT